jgi:hypothetical protein
MSKLLPRSLSPVGSRNSREAYSRSPYTRDPAFGNLTDVAFRVNNASHIDHLPVKSGPNMAHLFPFIGLILPLFQGLISTDIRK